MTPDFRYPRTPAFGLLLVCCLILTSCGRVGPIRPPQSVLPKPATELSVTNQPTGISIRFRRPTETVDRMDMDDLAYLEVWRDCAPKSPWQRIARFPIIDRGTMRKASWSELTDFDPSDGDTCTYSVIAETADGYRSAPAASMPIVRSTSEVAADPN